MSRHSFERPEFQIMRNIIMPNKPIPGSFCLLTFFVKESSSWSTRRLWVLPPAHRRLRPLSPRKDTCDRRIV